jgi:hypothetical protein
MLIERVVSRLSLSGAIGPRFALGQGLLCCFSWLLSSWGDLAIVLHDLREDIWLLESPGGISETAFETDCTIVSVFANDRRDHSPAHNFLITNKLRMNCLRAFLNDTQRPSHKPSIGIRSHSVKCPTVSSRNSLADMATLRFTGDITSRIAFEMISECL